MPTALAHYDLFTGLRLTDTVKAQPEAWRQTGQEVIGEADAGQTSAILFTLIEACRRRRIDPWEYLRDVLTRLPSMTNRQIEAVMPDAWAKARDTTGRSSSPAQHHCARRQAAA